jgi:uncharacterized membrane protein
MKYISGFLQFLHLISAVLAIGGVFFMRFILYPAMANLSPEKADVRQAISAKILPRFRIMIHSAIAILLATGTYRFIRNLPDLRGWTEYHAVFGVKVLLSLVLFGIAIALTLPPAPNPNPFQRRREKWLAVNFVLGVIILLLSGYLRRIWDYHT